ncbi:MAG: hypothetical protein A3A51_01450 [Candidatus Levybacteria bacterium RIFCSPLOWO2_01_FULL_39_10]|nr:MAG: hypothetical protein A3A51_01450 [Candidatus Levybacteria bacterium RIFCSPLOWO2_01_FULL_39_10]
MKPISPFGLPFGISITFWTIIGILRFITGKITTKKKRLYRRRFKPSDIAVVIPAHDEEVIIRKCIQAAKKSVRASQIYVASDGSKDKTYRRARMEECHVSKLNPGRGKARALKYLFQRYKLFERYKLIFIIDADTRMDKNCLKHALPLFNDKDIKVVFASSQIKWPKHIRPRLHYYFWAYRDRLNRLLQYCFVYGQTWKFTNVNYVVPGFATIYRSDALENLEIDTPGLLIEDFNLAFQIHKRKIGKLGYEPRMIGWDQYPSNLPDYWKQVRRWNIGFFQTVRINGIWPSFFWIALGVFSFEILMNSIFFILLPLIILTIASTFFSIGPFEKITNFYQSLPFYESYSIFDLFIGVFLIDYTITVIIGLWNKKPQFIFYGLFFFFMHYITSLILLSSIIPGFFGKSKGRWVSPKRQA